MAKTLEDYKHLEYQGKKLEHEGFKRFQSSGYNADVVATIDDIANTNRAKINEKKMRVASDAGSLGEEMILSARHPSTFISFGVDRYREIFGHD